MQQSRNISLADMDRESLMHPFTGIADHLRAGPRIMRRGRGVHVWDADEKEHFLRWQFDAQHKYYQENYPRARFDVILAGERPVGRLYVDRREDEIRIVDIALLPEHRGAGIGGWLMGELLAEADAAGVPVRIHVERNNPAMRLYHRLGFTETGDTGVYWLMERTPCGQKTQPNRKS